jgi:hypothetical protein
MMHVQRGWPAASPLVYADGLAIDLYAWARIAMRWDDDGLAHQEPAEPTTAAVDRMAAAYAEW